MNNASKRIFKSSKHCQPVLVVQNSTCWVSGNDGKNSRRDDRKMSDIEFSIHARDMLQERAIPEEWVMRTVNDPDDRADNGR